MSTITEIAPDVYRISIYVPEANLQFNQFVIKDDEPLLYHTGMKGIFPLVREAVARIIEPSQIRWIGFSHFEVDECGSLNEWLQVAPSAQAVCSVVGALVNLNDFADRCPRGMASDEVLSTGQSVQRRTYRTVGMQVCCLKRPTGHYYAQTCSIRTGMWKQ
jgi:flavorubredoxin